MYLYEKDTQKWLHYIRHYETISVLDKLPDRPIRILEVGGGDGYIASIFSGLGYEIISTDISPRQPSVFPVQKMSADHLDFPNQTFDIVFCLLFSPGAPTTNVLPDSERDRPKV